MVDVEAHAAHCRVAKHNIMYFEVYTKYINLIRSIIMRSRETYEVRHAREAYGDTA